MYKLIFDKEVNKFLKKQDATVRRRIRNALLELAENPYCASNVKQLAGRERQFRKRVGDCWMICKDSNSCTAAKSAVRIVETTGKVVPGGRLSRPDDKTQNHSR